MNVFIKKNNVNKLLKINQLFTYLWLKESKHYLLNFRIYKYKRY